jgi:hypothetical protein
MGNANEALGLWGKIIKLSEAMFLELENLQQKNSLCV